MTGSPLPRSSNGGPNPVVEALHDSSPVVYCASERAIEAATEAYIVGSGGPLDSGAMTDALIALHHPQLGQDRSVCLRDVLDLLRRFDYADGAPNREVKMAVQREAVAFIERTFEHDFPGEAAR